MPRPTSSVPSSVSDGFFTTRRWGTTAAVVLACLVFAGLAASEAGDDRLSVPEAVALGAVEGATEYLPVSSTAHLVVAQELLGLRSTPRTRNAADAYAVVVQVGAIAAVVGLYRHRIASLIRGLTGRDAAGRRLLMGLLVAFAPAAVVGVVAGDPVQQRLFGPWPIAVAWTIGGLALIVPRIRATRGATTLEELSLSAAAAIGAAQVLAMWPGTSRSLVTILAALAVGLTLKAAVEFSFLLGLVTLSAATGYESVTDGQRIIDAFGPANTIIGILVAFVAAWISMSWMVCYLQDRSLAPFGWYRIAAAATLMSLIVLTDLI